MFDTRTAPYAVFLLRLALGTLFIAHAALKIFVFTPAGTAQFFGSVGLSPGLAYLTIVWELAGAVALILGVWPRLAAVALVPVLLGAIATVHGPAGFFSPIPMGVGNFRRYGSLFFWQSHWLAMAPLLRGQRPRVRRRPVRVPQLSNRALLRKEMP